MHHTECGKNLYGAYRLPPWGIISIPQIYYTRLKFAMVSAALPSFNYKLAGEAAVMVCYNSP